MIQPRGRVRVGGENRHSIEIQSNIMILNEGEHRYRELLHFMKCGVQENDCSGTITYSNQAHHRMLGYTDGELLGRKIWDYLHPSLDKRSMKASFARLIETRPEPTPYRTKNITKNGISVDLQIDWDYAYNEKGDLTGFVSAITDVTERQNLEENICSLNREYASLLNMCKSLSETLDLQKVFQVSVDSVMELVGLDTAAVYLLVEDVLQLWAASPSLPPDFPEKMRSAPVADHPHVQMAIKTRKPLYIYDFPQADLAPAEMAVAENRNLRTILFVPLLLKEQAIGVFIVGSIENPKPLSDFRIELSSTLAGLASLSLKNARLFEESEKKSLRLQQMLVDRTRMMNEKSKLEAQLHHAQKMEAIGTLTGGVAHDFNNMLGGIMGAAELLTFYLPDDAKARQLHQIITESAIRAADLTKQLLAFSRQSIKLSTAVNLHKIIEEAITLVKRTLDKRISIEVNLGAERSIIVGDPSLLHNAVLNLCINASHAMSAGGTLSLNTREIALDEHFCKTSSFELHPGQYIEIEVRDNGCGIAREHLGRIFEPFFTTKETGKGTGLGLSSVYGTVKQHNGSITVYSEKGIGSTFQILLPLAEDSTICEMPVSQIKKGSGVILVVDDEEVMRSTAKAILEALGYEVILAEDGQVALDLFSQNKDRIDLVLLDMIMPVMNGRECFERLKKQDPQVNVILSSGFSTEDDLQEMKKAGLKGFIRKPYLASKLSQIVHEALNEKR